MATLKENTANGLFWGLLNGSSTQLLNLAIGIVLARLLTQADYGMLGMLTIFSGIAGTFNDSGLSVALVNKKDATAEDYDSVFAFNIVVSVVLYAILFFCAPLIAEFFHEPALCDLSRFVFLSIIFSAAGIVPGVILKKRLMVRERTIISFVALILSGIVGIVLALRGFTYWSLAWQNFIYCTATPLGCFFFARWHPTSHFSLRPIREMFGFSSKMLITSILNILNSNLLSVVFGRIYNATAVGTFNQANKWNMMAASNITTMVTQVAQPVFVDVREEGERRVRVFRKMLRFTAFLAFPAMFGLALVANEFITITISDKWAASALLLQILCVGGAFFCFHSLYQNLLISLGKSNVYMWLNILQIVLNIVVVLAFRPLGLTAMVIAFSACYVVLLAAWQGVARKYIGLKWTDCLRDILPFAAVSAATMIATYYLTLPIHNVYALLIARIAIAAALYYGAMRLLNVVIFKECLNFLKEKVFRKKQTLSRP